jgi:hypothetical protein
MMKDEKNIKYLASDGHDRSLFDLNRNLQEEYFYINGVENAIDSLETAVSFLDRNDNLKWKWIAISLHHSLYSFCVASLKNSNFTNVLSAINDGNLYIKKGNDERWKKSRKIMRKNCRGYTIEWEYTNEEPISKSTGKLNKEGENKLIGFWTALARVQDQTLWMGQLMCTKALVLTESEWQSIQWATEQVRNATVHFIPKYLAISIPSVKNASLDILRVIEFLALESYSVAYTNIDQAKNRINLALDTFRSKILV